MTGAFLLDWTEAHATCSRDGGQGCRYRGHDDLQDQFPDVLVFHGIFSG